MSLENKMNGVDESIEKYFENIISKTFVDSHVKQKKDLNEEELKDILYKEFINGVMYIIGKTNNFHFILRWKNGFSSIVMHEHLLKVLENVNYQDLFGKLTPEEFGNVVVQKQYLSTHLKENIKSKKIKI